MESEVQDGAHKSSKLVPTLGQKNSVHTFQLHIFVIQDLPPKFCMHFSYLPCVLHTSPVSSSLIWS
jgi:hypothetical protein